MHSNDDTDVTKDELLIKRQRALYRAKHRGTREMDFLLGHYAKAKVLTMDAGALIAFEQLMEMPDPVLAGALVDGIGEFDEQSQTLINRIRRFHKIIK
ncbi:MAG: succinate dehydrogenase assembly factor 2 [bacterium]|nr:succinate dehydrogenase assembly factor 2 [bacterium]